MGTVKNLPEGSISTYWWQHHTQHNEFAAACVETDDFAETNDHDSPSQELLTPTPLVERQLESLPLRNDKTRL